MEKLNVIDTEGNVLRQEYRETIHQKGLLHAEVHVWCATPTKELIFQHRAKDKDTFPDLLDATASGHVDIGETYTEAALKELTEETGIVATNDDLLFLQTEILTQYDQHTGLVNHPRRNIYLLKNLVTTDSLQVETGKAIGFVTYNIPTLLTLSKAEQVRFIPSLFNTEGLVLFKHIQNIILQNYEN